MLTPFRIILSLGLWLGAMFLPAGRWDLLWFWVHMGVVLAATLVLLFTIDRGLLQERLNPPPGGHDRSLRLVLAMLFFAHLVIAGLDAGRFHWSKEMPTGWRIAALVVFVAAMATFPWAMHVNRFFSPVVRIQSERGHHLVTTGPYRIVRHPGYLAAILAGLSSGIVLGSWWSLVPIAPIIVMLVRRTIIEDHFLHAHLEGYPAYAQRVRYRLAPWVW